MHTAAAILLVSLAAPVAAPPDAVVPAPAAGPAAPDPVAQLVGALARLPATTPVRAEVRHEVRFSQGEEDTASPTGAIQIIAAAGPDGLRTTWGPALLARAEAEERARLQNPDAYAPTRDALSDLRALALSRALDAVPDLLRDLVDARVISDGVEPFEGAPTRVLTLQVKPVVAARDRKYVKDVEATARLWLGADGVPVAEDRRVLLKGRIFLIIGFEIEQRDRIRFARSGDRLVELRRESVNRSAGAGERRDRNATTTLALLP
ncbi:MAG TPA: hypothetical protein VFM53_04850 [Anaeromyxobacteraceae bacterium]|nr:hypothetical protein [Anaeromyxobacteraceae bacterium]